VKRAELRGKVGCQGLIILDGGYTRVVRGGRRAASLNGD